MKRTMPRLILLLLSLGLLALVAGERIGLLRAFAAFHLLLGACIIFLLSSRPVFSLSTVVALGLAIRQISQAKYRLLNIPFLWQDLFYFVRPSIAVQNFGYYGTSLLIPLVIMLAVPVCLAFAYRMDIPVLPGMKRLPVLRLLAVSLVVMDAWLLTTGRPFGSTVDSWTVLTKRDAPLTTFLASMSSMRVILPVSSSTQAVGLWPNPLLVRSPSPMTSDGTTPGVLPDIVVIFEESTFNPRMLSECNTAECRCQLFEEDASTVSTGNVLVHIWGGGSWGSEFDFLVGLPHTIFGAGGNYAPFTLAPRVTHSLPRYLRHLGYRTITIYPVRKSFIRAQSAYTEYGFDEFYDPADLGLNWEPADQDILTVASRTLLHRRNQRPDQPVFLFALTYRQHGPHETPLDELSESFRQPLFPKLPEAVNLNLSNYLDRLHSSEEAMRSLEKVLASQATLRRPIVLAHFGDHQPSFGGLMDKLHPSNPAGVKDPKMVTYYMIKLFPDARQAPSKDRKTRQILDLAFLSSEIVEAARLPLDNYFAATAQYREACGGLFECPNRELEGSYLNYVLGRLQVVR